MANVPLYTRRIQPQTGVPEERQRGADYGPGFLSTALGAAGKGLAQVAEIQDGVEDFKARTEAQRLAIEYSEAARNIGNNVKGTLGEGAQAAAEHGITELEKAGGDILGRASPRARLLLQNEIGNKAIIYKDSWLDHGHGEQVKAFEAGSEARLKRTAEEAGDEPDEARALALIGQAGTVFDEQGQMFGWNADVVREKKRDYASKFFKSRALKMANGLDGSAKTALEYADKNRAALTDDDYNDILRVYSDNAMDEAAAQMFYGSEGETPTVTTNPEPEDGAPARALSFDGMWKSWYLPAEGSTYTIDNNGHPVKFGINGKAHPGVDIKGLTEGRAKQIIKSEYWDKLGIDKLPPAIGALAFDTAVIAGPPKAAQLLRQSGGDPDKFMELRKSFLAGLSAKDPKTYPPGTWDSRNAKLESLANRNGGAGTAPVIQVGPDSDLKGFEEGVMRRTDIGLAMKTKLVAMARNRRSELREERSIREGAAADALQTTVNNLGDNFTDIKQLPVEALTQASPQTIAQFTNLAKSNREGKPTSPELQREIEFKELADPRGFASKEYLDELRRKGASVATLRTVAARQGQIAGGLAAAKPDVIADGTLWSVAKKPFEAAGLFLETEESKGEGNKKAEKLADAKRQQQAVGFLRDLASRWAIANPGKKPDDATMRGWVGYALRNTSRGRGFELDDNEFFDRLDTHKKAQVIREFMRIDPNWMSKPEIEKRRQVNQYIRTEAALGGY